MFDCTVLKALSIFVIIITSLFYFYINRKFSYWRSLKVSNIKPNWFFGNVEEFQNGKKSLADFTVDIYSKFKEKKFGGIWEFHDPKFFIADPVLLRNILVKDFDVWSSRGVTVNTDVDPLAANLLNLDGKKWKSVRSKLSATFTSGKLKRMHNLLLECGREFENHLESLADLGEAVEMREISARYTTDVIGSCIFGIQMNSLVDDEAVFREMGRKIFEPSRRRKILRVIQYNFPWLFKLLKLSSTKQELTDFFINITKECFDYREKHDVVRNDFMDLLRALRNSNDYESAESDEEEIVFDDKLLAAQAFIFFGGGFESSSTAISFCLHELAANQEVQDRLREEILKAKAELKDNEVSWDGLKEMKYLDMVYQEALRKYPPFPVIERKSVKPYLIPNSDVLLPEGTTCIIPIFAVHRDPEFYPNPDDFDPERFSEVSKNQRPPFTFIPFGGGPRLCLGLRFGEQQAKMALFKLIGNFKVSLSEKSRNPIELDPKARFLLAKGGIWLRLTSLNRK